MSPRDLIGFAFTALVRHRLRTLLSLLGVAVGVVSVVVLTAVGEGARRYVTDQFASLGSGLVFVVPGKNETTGSFPGVGGVPNDLTLADATALQRKLRGIDRLAPVAIGNETVGYRQRRRQVTVLGSTEDLLAIRELRIAKGRFLPGGDMDRGGPQIVLGDKVARELFGNQSPLGRTVRLGDWRMRVIGVLEQRGMQVGVDTDDLVMIPVATAMRIFNRTSLFRVIVKAGAHGNVDRTCQEAVRILTERHDEEDVTCLTQESVISSLSSILTRLTLALGGIASHAQWLADRAHFDIKSFSNCLNNIMYCS